MAITKKDVTPPNHVSVRIAHTLIENDQEVGRSMERKAFSPDGDWSNEDDQVKAVCDDIFTDAVKKQYAKDNADKPV